MQYPSLSRSVQILLLLFLIFAALYFTRSFLIPFSLAGIISMLLLPLSRKFEARGLNKALSAFLCVLILFLLIAGLLALLGWQISDLAKDFDQMKQKLAQFGEQIKNFLNQKLGITQQEQKKLLQSGQSAGGGGMSTFLSTLMSTLVNFVLLIVYTFIFIYFREHLKKFILRLVPAEKMQKTEQIIHDSSEVAHKYLSGMAMMIVMLWVLYGIGFSIVGIKNAVFFAILCGVLEIVPFVGNLTGTAITLLMALTQGGGGTMAIGIVVTYFLVQFIQSYIIEPLVVGSEVNINPLFTIVSLVVGEMVWGIAGLVLAIPMLGIVKIICDNVEPLKPYGFLIGEEREKKSSFGDKLVGIFRRTKQKVEQ